MEAIIEGVPETRPGVYMVFYMKEYHPYAGAPETIEEFEAAYVEVKAVKSESLEQVWWHMQGMNWSPYGEARELIRSKGLRHTSMSVGDVIKDPAGAYWRVEDLGFSQLPFFGVGMATKKTNAEIEEAKNKLYPIYDRLPDDASKTEMRVVLDTLEWCLGEGEIVEEMLSIYA